LILTYGWPWTGALHWISGSAISLLTLSVTSRFEFATNEFVNDVAIVSFETSSTEAGSKDFVAVGTTINRGEDLAAKGAASTLDITVCYGDFFDRVSLFPFLRPIYSRLRKSFPIWLSRRNAGTNCAFDAETKPKVLLPPSAASVAISFLRWIKR
jgi:hypothetical protein